MDLLKKLNHKKTSLQDELENKEDEVERLKTKLISLIEEQEDSDEYSEKLDLQTQLEEAKRIEEVLKDKLDEKEEQCQKLEMEDKEDEFEILNNELIIQT